MLMRVWRHGFGEGEVKEILEGYERSLMKRAVIAFRLSPAGFFDEAFLLELVIDLRRKLERSGR